ncbi:winged helix-turn-helix domain-containing protein [Actinoplanes sp. NPDC051346]|uniref:ArsR/SmtB family transcription factor n=1 Tax=Actinoplanes sp. NPDC051346 TaxID=3155048 RepID=UPI003417496C
MVATRVVDDVETLKALADPARLAILELMMNDHDRRWTAKELAGAIGMPPKKIYYHLGQLEQRGLLEIRATGVVNGIIEKQYGAAQEAITFQRGTEPADVPATTPVEATHEMGEVVNTLFDEVRGNLLTGLHDGTAVMDRNAPDAKRALVSYSTARMAPGRAGEFRQALLDLVDRFSAATTPGEPTFELLVAIHPRSSAEPSDEKTAS